MDILLVMTTGLGLIWCAGTLSVVGFDLRVGLFSAVAFGLIFSLMLRSRKFSIAVGIAVVLAALACLFVWSQDNYAFSWFNYGHNSYTAWLSATFSGFIRPNTLWQNLSLAICSAALMFVLALVSRIKKRFVTFAIFFLAELGLIILQRSAGIPLPAPSVLISSGAVLMWFLRATYPASKGSEPLPNRGKYLLMFLPFVIAGTLLGGLMAENDQKTDRSLYRRLEDFFEQIRPKYAPAITSFDYFSINEMGFSSGDGVLGGVPSLNGDVKLFIIADKISDKPSYLAGKTSYDYADNQWATSEHEWFRYENRGQVYDRFESPVYTDPSFFDVMEMEFGEMMLYPDLEGELPATPATLRTQKVIFGAIATKTLFLPQDTMSVILGGGLTRHQSSRMLNIDDGQLLTGGQQSTNFAYEVQFMETNLSSIQRRQLLQNTYYGLYRDTFERYDEIGEEAAGAGFSPDLIELMADYSDWVHEEYTGIPEEMPQRVIDLALEITEGIDNDYDRAMAIRDYLVDNYEYSFEVEDVPEGMDFVDHFLFEQQRGYCSYFATSMAILSRAAGIPTRYVEGFRPGLRKLDDIFYFAAGYDAHAWVEAYFEGYGWVAFEATPPFRFDVDFYFLSREANAETYDEGGYDDSPYFEITPEEQDFYEGMPEQEIESTRFLNFFVTLARVVFWLAGLAVAIVVLLIIFNVLRHRRRLRFNTQSATTIAYAIRANRYILKILSELGLAIYLDETPIEHGERVDSKQFRYFERSVRRACEIYSAAVYGGKDPTLEEAEYLRAITLDLIEVAKRRYGWLRFFIYQNILGRF